MPEIEEIKNVVGSFLSYICLCGKSTIISGFHSKQALQGFPTAKALLSLGLILESAAGREGWAASQSGECKNLPTPGWFK